MDAIYRMVRAIFSDLDDPLKPDFEGPQLFNVKLAYFGNNTRRCTV